MFWDGLIQNSFVRASPSDVDLMEPGIIFALEGLWDGRSKWSQELATKSGSATKREIGNKNATRTK